MSVETQYISDFIPGRPFQIHRQVMNPVKPIPILFVVLEIMDSFGKLLLRREVKKHKVGTTPVPEEGSILNVGNKAPWMVDFIINLFADETPILAENPHYIIRLNTATKPYNVETGLFTYTNPHSYTNPTAYTDTTDSVGPLLSPPPPPYSQLPSGHHAHITPPIIMNTPLGHLKFRQYFVYDAPEVVAGPDPHTGHMNNEGGNTVVIPPKPLDALQPVLEIRADIPAPRFWWGQEGVLAKDPAYPVKPVVESPTSSTSTAGIWIRGKYFAEKIKF
jgi:hypothetical protein